jgi:hypothetical protein
MWKLSRLAIAAILLAIAPAASAQSPTEAQARAIIAPWYSLFNIATRGDVRAIQEQVLTIRDGKIAKTFHMENWLSALSQLRAK